MRIFADENTNRTIVQWLRSAGHDVIWAAEIRPGESDHAWLTLAEAESRLIVTGDKDFGELVFRDGLSTHGILLLRLDGISADRRLLRLAAVWPTVEANPAGSFTVVTEHKIRVRHPKNNLP